MASENSGRHIRCYTTAEITVTWEPARCRHTTECVRGLPAVFDPDRRPWIDPTAATPQALVETIDRCPSYALGYRTDVGQQRRAPE